MKHTEKLYLILHALYELRTNKDDILLLNLCTSQNIPLDSNEDIYEIAERLKNDGYIKYYHVRDGLFARITSLGTEYCEEKSSAYKGHSVANNYYSLNITNSPNANIISSSTNVEINQKNQIEIKNKIKELRTVINNQDNISDTEKQDLLDCLAEVESNIDSGRKPKFSFKQLSEQASNVAGVGSLLLDLGQLIF